jgi:hypothetical protein
MTDTHIPGPWHLVEYDNAFHVCRKWDGNVRPGDTQTYGSCYGAHIADVEHQGDDAPVVTRAQAEANARLIAAAPDLLAALLALVDRIGDMPGVLDDLHDEMAGAYEVLRRIGGAA